MDDLEFKQTFEDVCDLMCEIKYLEIPECSQFDHKFDCIDYLNEAKRLCAEWLEENKTRYHKIIKAEEDELNREFERSRLWVLMMNLLSGVLPC